MIRQVRIQNYKSILDDTIELGRLNIFIGENGCGKTNLLEALAMAGASIAGKLDSEELYSRGVRIAKPSVTFSSFVGQRQGKRIDISIAFDMPFKLEATTSEIVPSPIVKCCIRSDNANDIAAKWFDETVRPMQSGDGLDDITEGLAARMSAQGLYDLFNAAGVLENKLSAASKLSAVAKIRLANEIQPHAERIKELMWRMLLEPALGDYVIYNLNAPALRGIQPISRREPLGINGENLDVLISSFDAPTIKELLKRARLVSWVDSFFIDDDDTLKFKGHKLGRSVSALYFRDKFMRRNNNIFSAENANEGILHVLFYLALFLSKKTPRIFGIDNIETALNPRLCRRLISDMAALARKHDKQALVTTHNPAALDGLNLHDEEQRLFVVYRNDEGHTVTKRIKMKPDAGTTKMPLSELWMRGHLGGIPKEF